MKILLIGGGGREHALGWKLSQSPLVSDLVCAPGNPGLAALGRCVSVSADDCAALFDLAKTERPDLVVIGPEGPLAGGLADRLRAHDMAVFGPSAHAARLESSKAFTKAFCAHHAIPTARHMTVGTAGEARAFLQTLTPPYVLKADGLAAGKGVIITDDFDTACADSAAMLEGRFGTASAQIVIEEFLQGVEASVFALCDGKTVMPLIAARDHKRAFDGDKGPNTGGMGAYSPVAEVDPAMMNTVMQTIITPTITGMAAEGAPFCGVLYAGLMLGPDGPKLIEYNVRFGDPECQIIMMRMQSDLAPLLMACARGTLAQETPPHWQDGAAACVVMAARGYPGNYAKNCPLGGLEAAAQSPGAMVFHAGTRQDANGQLLSAGGRVLNICATGATLDEAVTNAYRAQNKIDFPDGFARTDIGRST